MTDNAQADDGWIEWSGGECPIEDPNAVVEVQFRDGHTHTDNDAAGWTWEDRGHSFDIIAYRVVSQ